MRKRRACQAVALRLGINPNRVAALVQRCSEAGLLPVACGSDRPHLTNLELARLVLVAVSDNGLGNAPATLREFAALESNGLRLDDWLESLLAGRVNAEPVVSVIFQLEPAACTVISASSQLDFGQRSDSPTTRVTAISGEALRAIIGDFNGLG